jgi:6-phosphogluconolactonase
MTAPRLVICGDPEALALAAADFVAECAREATQERGRFTLVLSGGSTPEGMSEILALPDRAAAIDWTKTCVFFGDERMVPPDDPRSNFGMARRRLLSRVPVPPHQVFPVPTQERTAAEAAVGYAAELARCFGADAGRRRPPRFDLVLLGLGEDGHTASLFPGAAALAVEDAWVTWSPPGTLPPPVDRVTLTYPVLNAARHVAFLAAGAKKAAALRDVLEGNTAREKCPATGIRPTDGTVTWFVDRDAAGRLTRNR